MNTTFVEITQPHIITTLAKNNTRVLALLLFYETRAYNSKKAFRVLSCVVYTIISYYVYVDYLACESKNK